MRIGSRYALIGLRDGGIAVLDRPSEKFLRHINASSSRIRSLSLSPDETWALAGDELGKFHRFSLPDGRTEEPLAPHLDSIEEIVFIGDSVIASGSADRTIRFWNPDGALLFTLPLPRAVKQMRVSPDGKQLLVLLRDDGAHSRLASRSAAEAFRGVGDWRQTGSVTSPDTIFSWSDFLSVRRVWRRKRLFRSRIVRRVHHSPNCSGATS